MRADDKLVLAFQVPNSADLALLHGSLTKENALAVAAVAKVAAAGHSTDGGDQSPALRLLSPDCPRPVVDADDVARKRQA